MYMQGTSLEEYQEDRLPPGCLEAKAGELAFYSMSFCAFWILYHVLEYFIQ